MRYEDNPNILTLERLLRILRRWSWVIALMMMVLLGTAMGYGLLQTPTYEASSLVLIREERVNDANGTQGIQFEVEGLKAITPTMARAATSRPVVDASIRKLDTPATPEALAARLTAEPVPDTQFITITYQDTSPQTAQRVANTVGTTFSEQVPRLNPIATPVTAVVWERAALPEEPVGLGIPVVGALAVATGLILGVLLAFALEALSASGAFRKGRHRKR